MREDFSLGFKLPNSGPLASAEKLHALTVAAERLGYGAVWVTDHTNWTVDDARYHFPSGAAEAWTFPIEPNYFEPLTLLSYLAAATSRITLGTAIIALPLRNPVSLAKQVACLDHLAGGRLVFGVGVGGTGYARRELAALDLGHLKGKRGKVADEWIDVIRCIWRQPSCSFVGQFIHVDAAEVYPKPLQPGGPPLWIAGPGEASLHRTARCGDGWFLNHLLPDQVRASAARLREEAGRLGRDSSTIRLSTELWVSIDPDEVRARENARATFEGMSTRAFFGHRPTARDDTADPFAHHLVGRPDQMVERVAAYREAGIHHLVLRVVARDVPQMVESLQMFREEVAKELPT
jgi:probable F420-dependent oxidoreductase